VVGDEQRVDRKLVANKGASKQADRGGECPGSSADGVERLLRQSPATSSLQRLTKSLRCLSLCRVEDSYVVLQRGCRRWVPEQSLDDLNWGANSGVIVLNVARPRALNDM
jgi:hypothetical protein